MTDAQKAAIDAMSYEDLLGRWRFAPSGDPLLRNDTGAGQYYAARMAALRAEPGGDERHVAASKRIGWD